MALDNFNDLSDHGNGYQFEFYCAHCSRRWKSEFKANRLGQFTRLLSQVSEFFNGTRKASHTTYKLGEFRGDGPHRSALEDAQEQAANMFTVCGVCSRAVCNECFDSNEQACEPCVRRERGTPGGGSSDGGGSARGGSGPACPNCSTPSSGGRFCAECGFDMASTHKSCPGCGSMCERSTRFCADCGHGF